MNYSMISKSYEDMLDRAWEDYNEEGPLWEDLDQYDLADQLYEESQGQGQY